jgi:hypothetical protein
MPSQPDGNIKDISRTHVSGREKDNSFAFSLFPSANEAQDIKDTKASFIPSPLGTKIRRKSHRMLCRTTQHAPIAGPRCLCVAPL